MFGSAPPPSTPSAAGQRPAATAAAEPPDEPPDTLVLSYGLRLALHHRRLKVREENQCQWASHSGCTISPRYSEPASISNGGLYGELVQIKAKILH